MVEGRRVLAGNRKLLEENCVAFVVPEEANAYIQEGSTAIYVAVDGKFVGYIAPGRHTSPGECGDNSAAFQLKRGADPSDWRS